MFSYFGSSVCLLNVIHVHKSYKVRGWLILNLFWPDLQQCDVLCSSSCFWFAEVGTYPTCLAMFGSRLQVLLVTQTLLLQTLWYALHLYNADDCLTLVQCRWLLGTDIWAALLLCVAFHNAANAPISLTFLYGRFSIPIFPLEIIPVGISGGFFRGRDISSCPLFMALYFIVKLVCAFTNVNPGFIG